MKKLLTVLLIGFLTTALNAQDYRDRDSYYDDVENYEGLNITAAQKRKIIDLKKNIGRRHAEIGKSRLRGYEKGEAHRKLNQQIRKEIDEILNSSQKEIWKKRGESKRIYKFGKNYKKWALEYKLDAIDDKIDDIEDYYEDLIDTVENDKRLPKAERKARKEALKKELKTIKKELKREKQKLKSSKYN